MNVPIGVVALILTRRLARPIEPRGNTIRSQIDFVGVALLGVATVGRSGGDFPLAATVAIACAVMFLAAALVVAVSEPRAGRRGLESTAERTTFDDAVRASDV